VRAAAEAAARDAYGRLIALLAARTCDIAAAEDAMSAAFVSALVVWPTRGIPDKPEAWLLTAARRNLIDIGRRQTSARKAVPDLIRLVDDTFEPTDTHSAFPDERLKLMFICAHPALDSGLHTPLMLQTVLGFDAKRIARVYLLSASAMGQRLVRAKAKLRELQPKFIEPDQTEWPKRLNAVHQAVYAAYTCGWDMPGQKSAPESGFAREAMALARMLTGLVPDNGETLGLLALILYCEARRPARLDEGENYMPLSLQDTGLWNATLIDRAEMVLHHALERGPAGRFVLEAAIQSAHCARRQTGQTDHAALLALYDRLICVHPGLGARIARAGVLGEVGEIAAGLEALDELEGERDMRGGRLDQYQPYWAARAHLLALAGQTTDATQAYQRAAKLTPDASVRRFLRDRSATL